MKKKPFCRLFKALAVFTAVTCSLSLSAAAYAGEEDAAAIYRSAAEKTSELTSADLYMTMDLNLALGEETLFIPITSDLKMEGLSKSSLENFKMEALTSATIESVPLEIDIYYADGYLYMDAMGNKLKFGMDLAELSGFSLADPQAQIDAADYMDIGLDESAEGTVLTYTISGDVMQSIIDETMDSMKGSMGDTEIEMSVSDISGTMSITDDGYIGDLTMKMPFSASVEGQELAMDMNLHMEYTNPGQPVSVELPPLDDYEEFDMGTLAQDAAASSAA